MEKGNENENSYVDHVLDPKTVVSSTDLTGLLQGMPLDDEDIGQFSDVHNIPAQGGLMQLGEQTDTDVRQYIDRDSETELNTPICGKRLFDSLNTHK